MFSLEVPLFNVVFKLNSPSFEFKRVLYQPFPIPTSVQFHSKSVLLGLEILTGLPL